MGKNGAVEEVELSFIRLKRGLRLTDLVTAVKESTRRSFEEDGGVHMHFAVITSLNPETMERADRYSAIGVPVAYPDSGEYKVMIRDLVSELSSRYKAVMVVMSAEAWVVAVEKGDDLSQLSCSQHPDRQEVVLVQIERHDGVDVYRADIERGDPDVLGDWVHTPAAGSAGRLCSLLAKPELDVQ